MKIRIYAAIILVFTFAMLISACAKGDGKTTETTAGNSTTAATTGGEQTTAPSETTKTADTTKTAETTKAAETTAAVTTKPEPTADISKHLITHWDFSGASLSEQLSDKATGGKSKDDLTIVGNVSIKNGKATVSSEPEIYMYAKNQSDMNSYSEFTYFVKLKAVGTPFGFADFISKPGENLFRAFINDTKSIDTKYFIDCRFKSNISKSWAFENPQTFTAEMDFYIALTARLDTSGQKIYLASYKSYDGITYDAGAERSFPESDKAIGIASDFSADPTNGALFIGKHYGNRAKDMGITYEFDDIRIYNKALTLDEVASIKVSS